MKPIKLTMQSFGSYGDKTVIDFTTPEQNLFLVTGDTGSGKSTIFDAIVFALYGETGSCTNKKSGNELQSQFSEKDSFVELVFTEKRGNEIGQYTVRRELKQKSPSTSGGKPKIIKNVTLILPDGKAVPPKEVEAKLEEIVVLTKGQFMQVSMIAQGEFMEFLRSNSNKKKEILRKLFNTEIFEKIVEELKNRRKSTSEQIKVIQNICRAEASHIVIPENYENVCFMNELKQSFMTDKISAYKLESLVDYLKDLCSVMEKQKVSAEKDYNKALKNSQEKRDILKDAQSLLKTFEEMEKAEKGLEECKKAEPVIKQKAELIQKINSAYEIQAVYNRYADVYATAEDVRKKLNQQKEALPELETEYTGLADREREALDLKNSAVAEFVQTEERVRNNMETFGKIARAEKDISAKKKEVSATEKRAENIRDKISELEKNMSWCQKTAEKLPEAEKLMLEWKVKRDETERIFKDYDALVKIHNDIVARKKKSEEISNEYVSARQKYTSIMTEYTAKRTAFLDAQAGFIASEKLRDGQPCPVCGSLEHPNPCKLSDAFSSITREVIDELSKEVSRLDSIQNEKSALANSAREFLEERMKVYCDSADSLRERMAKIIPDVPEEPDISQINEILSVWKPQVKAEGETLAENMAECQKASEMYGKYNDEKSKLIPELETVNSRLSEINAEISGSVRLLNELKESLCYADESSAEKALSIAEALKNEKTNHYNNISVKLDSVRRNLEQAKTLIKKYNEELPELEKTLEERKNEYITITEKYSLEEWNDITEKFRKDYINILQSEVEEHNQRKVSFETTYRLSEKTVGDRKRPDIDLLEKNDIEAFRTFEKAREDLEECRAVFKADSDTYKTLSSYTAEYTRLDEDYNSLDRLCGRLSGTASGEHIGIETFVQRYYLQRILDFANVHFQRMSGGQFELRLMDENQASSSGRTERGLELIIYSTVTDSEREVRTLSGGETFIAALSLALGMSEQIQENATAVNQDIMFIDEGFGSLDDHSRSQAVRILKELAEENRFIGIISHVTEMKQEIDSQLVVTKDSNGSHTRWIIN